MPQSCLLREGFQACPTRWRPLVRPRTHWRDYVYWLAWECLGILLEEGAVERYSCKLTLKQAADNGKIYRQSSQVKYENQHLRLAELQKANWVKYIFSVYVSDKQRHIYNTILHLNFFNTAKQTQTTILYHKVVGNMNSCWAEDYIVLSSLALNSLQRGLCFEVFRITTFILVQLLLFVVLIF